MTTAATLSSEQVIALAKQHVIGNYTRYAVCLVRGEGSHVWDAEGNRYLDYFPGWGCGLLGHCPPRVVAAVQKQVAELIHVPNTWYTAPPGLLAEALAARTGGGEGHREGDLRHPGRADPGGGRHQHPTGRLPRGAAAAVRRASAAADLR